MTSPARSRVELNSQVLLFGQEAAGARLNAEVQQRGWSRVALLASGSTVASGLRDRVVASALAGIDCLVVPDVIGGHAPISGTERIAAALARERLDALIALGGGSVSDTAKGVAILLAEGGSLEQHCSVFRPPDRFEPGQLFAPKLPVVAVPTTLSGAEVTPGGGATTAEGVKRTFWDPKVACAIVAFDPEVLRQVPRPLLVSTGMNALAHCAEGLYSRTANPVSTALAIEGTRRLVEGLRAISAPDGASQGTWPEDALVAIGEGAALSGLVITNARVGLHHAICHVLGAKLGLPHGTANSIMLPTVLRYNAPETEAAQRSLAVALHAPDLPAADAVDQLRVALGAPRLLREVGVDRGALSGVAQGVMQDRGLYFNPRRVEGPGTVLALLEEAW